MLETLLQTLLGVGFGIITGLIPGVHINLVSQLALRLGIVESYAATLVAMGVTHSTLDVIPGILFGAPESDTALGVLPGHRYVLRGNGYMAIKLTLVGSLLGLLLAFLLLPVWWFAVRLYPLVAPWMGYILLLVSAYMIFRDPKPRWALLVYLFSGILGFIVLRRAVVEQPLFPLLSGLFGTATLLYSLTQESAVPNQHIEPRIELKKKPTIVALIAGNISGFLTSMLPGLGSAQAAIISMQFARKLGDHGFLILIGAISTVNFTLSLVSWLLLDKARNGVVVALQQSMPITPVIFFQLLAVALLAMALSVPLCLYLARISVRVVSKVPYKPLCASIVCLVTLLVFLLCGWRGMLVLSCATCIGLVPAIVRCGRAHAMGCLMLPVALFFL